MVAWHHLSEMNENEPNNMYKDDKQSQNNNRTSWNGSSTEWMTEEWLRHREIEREKRANIYSYSSHSHLWIWVCARQTADWLINSAQNMFRRCLLFQLLFSVSPFPAHNVARCVMWIMNLVMCRIMTFEIKQFILTKMGERSLLRSLSLSFNACYMTATRIKGVKRVQTKRKQRKE